MKWILRTAASLFPLSAALSVSDGAAASSIPTVPKVQNADADGFPLLPEVASLFKDVSRTVQGLRHEASTLQEELHNVEQRSHGKMTKQKAAYDQLLKKQEQANQKIQGQNAQRAKSMMKLRDTARTTQAEIKKEEGVNGHQRLKLKALQKQLEQATKATQDALGVSEDAQPTHTKASRQAVTEEDYSSSDETSSGTVADALVVEEEPPRRSLSFLEIRRAAPATASSVEKSDDEEDDYGPDDAEPTQNKLAVKKAALPSPQDWPASVLGKHSDAMSQAPISMWKEYHGEPGWPASHNLQGDPAAVLGKHSGAKSQPIKSSSAGKSLTKNAVAAVAGEHAHAKSQPAKSSQAAILRACELASASSKACEDAKASTAKPTSAMRKIVSGPRVHQKSVQRAEPSNAASMAVKASMESPVQETTSQSSKAEEAASDEHVEQQLIEEAGEAADTDKAHENLMPDADEQSQVLHEGASSSEGMVASLSQGVKRIQVAVQRSEAQLKLHFQKAYKAGKTRLAALIKQSEALDKNLHSMQLQEKKLETTLAKARAADKTLKQKIRAIGGILNRAVSPITSKQIA